MPETGSEKYALVTGASSGIGWHISVELAGRGYGIIAVSNQAERLEELKIELETRSRVSVELINLNLATEESAELVFDHCRKKGLEVEVLVNNAGMFVYGETSGIPPESVKEIIQLHITTPALLCRLFGEKMIPLGKGYMLNVSSISSVMPFPTISLYGPTKAFLRKYTRAIRTELKFHGINCTCLIPGATDTAFYENTDPVIRKWIKLGSRHEPEWVARRGIRALFRNRSECIPGLWNKIVMGMAPIIPHSLIGLIYRRMRT